MWQIGNLWPIVNRLLSNKPLYQCGRAWNTLQERGVAHDLIPDQASLPAAPDRGSRLLPEPGNRPCHWMHPSAPAPGRVHVVRCGQNRRGLTPGWRVRVLPHGALPNHRSKNSPPWPYRPRSTIPDARLRRWCKYGRPAWESQSKPHLKSAPCDSDARPGHRRRD